MKIRILGWKYQNIRRMKDLDVDLTMDGKVYRNSLIMMPNGTGKTTTLTLIRAIFSGSATTWRVADIRTFQPVGDDTSEGSFHLRVQFDEDIYYYILHLNYEEGRAWYETSSVMMEGGYEEGRRLPYSLRDVFRNEEFVNRFVFNGEQARKTLNSGSREAENAILYLYQLDRLDDLSKNIDGLVQMREKQNIGSNTSRSVKIYKGKEEKKRQIYRDLQRDRQDLERRLVRMRENLQRQENKYQKILAQNGQLNSEVEKLQQQKEENQEKRIQTEQELLQCIRMPYNLQLDFHTRLKTLVENMQVLKLPRNTAREFFKELASGKTCLCGRPIGKAEKKHILEKADGYLGAEALVVVNSIKSALREYQRDESAMDKAERLKKLLKEETEISQSNERLTLRLKKDGNVETAQLQDKIKILEREIEESEHRLEMLVTKDPALEYGLNAENNIPLAKEAWEIARENYLQVIGTYEFTMKADRMKEYLERVKENTLTLLKQYVVRETNEKTARLLADDTILIKKIDGHLVIDGKDGASEGQTLAIAYAFIGTLFEHSSFEFPFVVDSPAAPMDLQVRREVARILPELFGQTVILVTSGEKNGFAEEFYARDDVGYITIKGEKEQPVVKVLGRPFFEQYQEKDNRRE